MKQKYKYRARTENGQLKKGVIIAEGMSGAVTFLRNKHYWIIDIELAPFKANKHNIFQKKTSSKELAFLSQQLASLINSGVPVLNALKILSKQNENKKFKHILIQLMNDLTSGSSLSEALSFHPQFFPGVFINMIAAGEAGGVLGQILNRVSLHYEKVHELAARVKTALIYPVLVIIIALISVVLLLTMVIPTFENMLRDMNTTLPLVTLMIIKANNFLMDYWYYILGIFLILCCTFAVWFSTGKGKEILDNIIVRTPILGSLVQKVILSRFCRTFSALIHSGVPILAALEIVKETINNTAILRAVTQACLCIEKGESIAAPLQKSGFFPPIVIQMIEVGEETGALGELLEKVAIMYDREINAIASRISSLIEPFLVLLIGGIVGFVVIAILLPIYQTIGSFE